MRLQPGLDRPYLGHGGSPQKHLGFMRAALKYAPKVLGICQNLEGCPQPPFGQLGAGH